MEILLALKKGLSIGWGGNTDITAYVYVAQQRGRGTVWGPDRKPELRPSFITEILFIVVF
jgi:hypothetical protein